MLPVCDVSQTITVRGVSSRKLPSKPPHPLNNQSHGRVNVECHAIMQDERDSSRIRHNIRLVLGR